LQLIHDGRDHVVAPFAFISSPDYGFFAGAGVFVVVDVDVVVVVVLVVVSFLALSIFIVVSAAIVVAGAGATAAAGASSFLSAQAARASTAATRAIRFMGVLLNGIIGAIETAPNTQCSYNCTTYRFPAPWSRVIGP
jgi:hypothetical protein